MSAAAPAPVADRSAFGALSPAEFKAAFRHHAVGEGPVGLTATSVVVAVHALEVRLPDDTDDAPLVYHDRTWHALGEHSRLDV